MNRHLVSAFAVALFVLAPRSVAAASPYSLVAKYQPADAKAAPISIPLDAVGTVVPRDVNGATYLGVFIDFHDDEMSKATLATYRNILITPAAEPALGASGIPRDPPRDKVGTDVVVDVKAPFDKPSVLVLPPNANLGSAAATRVRFDVHAKFAPTYLCALEIAARRGGQKDEKRPALPSYLPRDSKSHIFSTEDDPKKWANQESVAYDVIVDMALDDDHGDVIVYSFCKDVVEAIHYDNLASARAAAAAPKSTKAPAPVDAAAALRAAEKKKLVTVLMKAGFDAAPAFGPVRYDRDADGANDNVFVQAAHTVTIADELGSYFDFVEVENDGKEIAKVVDQVSHLELRVARDDKKGAAFCELVPPPCNSFVGERLVVKVAYTGRDGKTSEEKLETSPLNGKRWALDAHLSKHLKETVQLTLVYRAGDAELELARTEPFTVENLGVITTFPAFTEVANLLRSDAKNPADIETQSTIPISWGVNLSARRPEAAHMAVTLPFRIGYNSRTAPRLAETISGFVHFSTVFPLENDAALKGPAGAFGVGVQLADAFTFAWGSTFTTAQPVQQFLLLGISAPDLAKLFDNTGATSTK